MTEIRVLEQATIDRIAAGEVVERPSSIVKELCENAIDAGASAITVEIRDGGISLIRVTDNGEGIDPGQVRTAFLRHATSKITKVDDLMTITSFGFRGEALSSIAAVSRVELITKTRDSLTGIRCRIEGGTETLFEEIGAPEGSTFLVRDLFYNTPARRKFLKSPQTEAGYISDFVSRLALSHPQISVKFMVNGTTKLSTSGSGSQKDVIYAVFGRDITANLIEADKVDEENGLHLTGWIGKPQISRGNRTNEIFFVNGRLIWNSILSKAVEEGYETFLMQHKFPFVILSLDLPGDRVDVNVHPAKSQVRFSDGPSVYAFVRDSVRDLLTHRELIIDTSFGSVREEEEKKKEARRRALEAVRESSVPEPFEKMRREHLGDSVYGRKYPDAERQAASARDRIGQSQRFLQEASQLSLFDEDVPAGPAPDMVREAGPLYAAGDRDREAGPEAGPADSLSGGHAQEAGQGAGSAAPFSGGHAQDAGQGAGSADPFSGGHAQDAGQEAGSGASGRQAELEQFLTQEHRKEHRLIGQVFGTYWIVEFRDSLYIIDQHAAHEKVMFERLMEKFRTKRAASQMLSPSVIVSLTMAEEDTLQANMELFTSIGFEVDSFGGHDYAISAVPQDLFGLTEKEYFLEMLDSLSADTGKQSIETVTARLATMACKAAVKGNTRLSSEEADELITELLTLDNPYNCPHGRPTILSMSEAEIEKKFHRIV